MIKKYLIIMGIVIFSFVLVGCASNELEHMTGNELNAVCGGKFSSSYVVSGNLACKMTIEDYRFNLWVDFCNQENITTRDCLNYHVYVTK